MSELCHILAAGAPMDFPSGVQFYGDNRLIVWRPRGLVDETTALHAAICHSEATGVSRKLDGGAGAHCCAFVATA